MPAYTNEAANVGCKGSETPMEEALLVLSRRASTYEDLVKRLILAVSAPSPEKEIVGGDPSPPARTVSDKVNTVIAGLNRSNNSLEAIIERLEGHLGTWKIFVLE